MHASTILVSRYRQPAIILAMASIACLLGSASRAAGQDRESELEEETRDRILQERVRQAENLHTRQQVEQFAASVGDAGKLLMELESKGSAFQARFDSLLTNDDGKRLAQDPIAFMTYIRFKDDPVVSLSEVAARKKALDSLLTQLQSELKSQNVGYQPPESQRRDTDEHRFWARERLARVKERGEWLESALARAPTVADPKSAKTLDAVVRAYDIERQEFWDRAHQKGEAAAKAESESILIEKARLAELERRLNEAEVLIDKMKAEQEIELKRIRTETQQKLADADIREKNLLAELERSKKLADAERHSKDVEAELKSGQIVSEAEKKRLIAKCSDPEVKTILAPFLDKGYFRPSDNMHGSRRYDTVKPVPISYADLQKLGALNPTGTGLSMLHKIATVPNDTRTRWPGYRKKWQDDKALQELLPKAQELLIELGPTMVELGMLQP